MKMWYSLYDKNGVELLTAFNFCIWRNSVLRCDCTSKTPAVIETNVAFNKTWLPDAVALEVEPETGLSASYILANIRITTSMFGLLLIPCQKQYVRNQDIRCQNTQLDTSIFLVPYRIKILGIVDSTVDHMWFIPSPCMSTLCLPTHMYTIIHHVCATVDFVRFLPKLTVII